MTKITYTATDANGTVHKRTSDRRHYTHTVVAKWNYEYDMAQATSKGWAKTDASNYAYTVQIAEGNAPYPEKNYKTIERGYTAEQMATEQARVDARNEADFEAAKARVGNHTVQSWCAERQAERVAAVETDKAAGRYDQFVNQGWCGRLDLAQKLAANCTVGGRYIEATILVATGDDMPIKRKVA